MSAEQIGETEEEFVSRIAEKIVKSKMDSIALFFLETIGPTSDVWIQLSRIYLQPLFILLGPDSEKLLSFTEKPENIEKLVRKIEEYQIREEEAKKGKESFFSRIRRKLSFH